jgi:large subunit ribosomal protein L25
MPDRIVLHASPRTIMGKKVKRLRQQGILPATVYGHHVAPQSIQVDGREFRTVYHTAGKAQLVDLIIENQRPRPVLIQNIQIDPRRNVIIHVEFYQTNPREKVTANVPIRVVGEAPAERAGGIVLTVLDTIEVECLPADLPSHIDVDVSGLTEINAAVHVRDLAIDRSRVDVKSDPDEVVVKIEAPQMGVEEGAAAAGMTVVKEEQG